MPKGERSNLLARLSASCGGLDSGGEGRFSGRIRLKWWVRLVSPDMGKSLASSQDLIIPQRNWDAGQIGNQKGYFPIDMQDALYPSQMSVVRGHSFAETAQKRRHHTAGK